MAQAKSLLSYGKRYEIAQKEGGYFDLSGWGVIEISGKDAKDYLHRMTTVDFRNFPQGKVAHGAWLNGKGQVQSLGFFLSVAPECFEYWVPAGQAPMARELIEKFHFSEAFTVLDNSFSWALVGLWYPIDSAPRQGFPTGVRPPFAASTIEWQGQSFLGWQDDKRSPLVWWRVPRGRFSSLEAILGSFCIQPLGLDLFDYFRIEAGVPEFGREVLETHILLEANFESAAARQKGCYPGQEVIERIYTYGSVNRKLFRVTLRGETFPKPSVFPLPLYKDKVLAGQLMSAVPYPEKEGEGRGLAMLQKNFWGLEDEMVSETPLFKVYPIR